MVVEWEPHSFSEEDRLTRSAIDTGHLKNAEVIPNPRVTRKKIIMTQVKTNAGSRSPRPPNLLTAANTSRSTIRTIMPPPARRACTVLEKNPFTRATLAIAPATPRAYFTAGTALIASRTISKGPPDGTCPAPIGGMDDFFKWLSCNGKQNCYPGAQYPLTDVWRYLLGGPSRKNNYCGPNGAGDPLSRNDWACAVHDYNYRQIGGEGKHNNFFSNPDPATASRLRQADRVLFDNLSGAEGAAIKVAVEPLGTAVNAYYLMRQ